MKYNKILIPLLIVVVISLSGCITDSLIKDGQTFESNGITFQYPDSWQQANSVAEGSIAAVVDTNDSRVSVVIQQVPSEYGSEIQEACSKNNINLVKSPNYINIQEIKTTVNGREVIVHRYLINEADGSQKEHVATWMKMNDGKLYVLLFSAPVELYEQQRSGYDLVAGTFALQGESISYSTNADNSSNTQSNSSNTLLDGISNQINKFFTN